MVALALTLQLFGGTAAAAHTPDLHLVPPLALAQAGADAGAAPDLSPREPRQPRAAGTAAGFGWGVSSSLGFLLGDVVAGAMAALGMIAILGDIYDGSGTASEGVALLLLSVPTWLFLPPELGVSGAIRAGAPPDARRRAYWTAFGVRLAGMLLASLVGRNASDLGTAAIIATDLVVAPWVVVRVLQGAAARPVEAPLPSPAALARPVPAGAA